MAKKSFTTDDLLDVLPYLEFDMFSLQESSEKLAMGEAFGIKPPEKKVQPV